MTNFINYPDVRAFVIHLTESGLFTYKERLNVLLHWQDHDSLSDYISESKKISEFKIFAINKPYAHYLKLYQQENIQVLSLIDEKYPPLLREIYQPPIVLFAQGNLELLDKSSLSVVGSREMSVYGKQVLDYLVPAISQQLVIISGLAKGVDFTAHQLAINHQGATIAVVGTGLSYFYPKVHENFQKKIAKEQLLLSPFPYYANVQKWHFVYRNRIIAGLSQGTLVIEAGIKSGSLITANYALQENRDVFAVPGSINAHNSRGTNRLIQLGAKLVLTSEDVIEEYGQFQ